MTIKIQEAIISINNNAEYSIKGTDIDTCEITWLNGTSEISKADIKTKMAKLKTTYDNNKYQRDRVYPSIGDQLDMLWHSIDQNAELKQKYFAFYEAIKAVKAKYPK